MLENQCFIKYECLFLIKVQIRCVGKNLPTLFICFTYTI